MSRAGNADRGLVAERHACDKWHLEHLATDATAPDWLDARASRDVVTDLGSVVLSEGTPVDVKSCWRAYDSGRCGRIKISKPNHDRLLEADGEYVIVVLDEETNEVLRSALTSARTVDALIDSWWSSGRSRRDSGPFVQLPWSRFFDDVGGESA